MTFPNQTTKRQWPRWQNEFSRDHEILWLMPWSQLYTLLFNTTRFTAQLS